MDGTAASPRIRWNTWILLSGHLADLCVLELLIGLLWTYIFSTEKESFGWVVSKIPAHCNPLILFMPLLCSSAIIPNDECVVQSYVHVLPSLSKAFPYSLDLSFSVLPVVFTNDIVYQSGGFYGSCLPHKAVNSSRTGAFSYISFHIGEVFCNEKISIWQPYFRDRTGKDKNKHRYKHVWKGTRI